MHDVSPPSLLNPMQHCAYQVCTVCSAGTAAYAGFLPAELWQVSATSSQGLLLHGSSCTVVTGHFLRFKPPAAPSSHGGISTGARDNDEPFCDGMLCAPVDKKQVNADAIGPALCC